MFSQKLIDKLKANWPHQLDCYAECRVYDPASCAEWYLLACDPDNPDSATAIINLEEPRLDFISIEELSHVLNAEGERLKVDPYFRRTKGAEIWTKLNKKKNGTYGQ